MEVMILENEKSWYTWFCYIHISSFFTPCTCKRLSLGEGGQILADINQLVCPALELRRLNGRIITSDRNNKTGKTTISSQWEERQWEEGIHH